MHIEGYDGWAGEFPFEVGDVCLTEEKDDIGILLYANSAYVHFWYLFFPGISCARIERVIDEYAKIGHVETSVVERLLDMYARAVEHEVEKLRRKHERKETL